MKFLYTFSVDRLHIDNCRSRGDHHDDDCLTIAVRVDDHAPQTASFLAAPQVHAGEDRAGPWTVGPLLIDDSQSVQWMFSLVNLSGSDVEKQQGERLRIVLGVESALMAVGGLAIMDAEKEAAAILGAVSAVISGLAELLGWLLSNPSNPNCNGEVFTNLVQFAPGDLLRLGTWCTARW